MQDALIHTRNKVINKRAIVFCLLGVYSLMRETDIKQIIAQVNEYLIMILMTTQKMQGIL